MPSAAVARIRQRIGTLGLPNVVWVVIEPDDVMVAFYDRDKADAHAAAAPGRVAMSRPVAMKDAFETC